MKRHSILQDKKQCYVCGSLNNIHIHEVYYGKNRQKSIANGLCIYLCGRHHNQSNEGIHFNHNLDLKVKKEMEKRWLEINNKTIDDFIKLIGKNYL